MVLGFTTAANAAKNTVGSEKVFAGDLAATSMAADPRRALDAVLRAEIAQEAAADGIGRHENIGRLGMKMVLRRAQKSKALLGDFEIAGTVIGLIAILLRIAHKICLLSRPKPFRKIAGKVNFGKLPPRTAADYCLRQTFK